jgi:ATP-dependent Clp protease ATP-binding subunit ClpC
MKYTDAAKKILKFDGEEARKFGSDRIGAEHLFLGIVRSSKGITSLILANCGIDGRSANRAFANVYGEQTNPSEKPVIDESAKRVIDIAEEEREILGEEITGSQHLLYALADFEDERLDEFFSEMGITRQRIREKILDTCAYR